MIPITPFLYFIADTSVFENPIDAAIAAQKGGAKLVQLRAKNMDARDMIRLALAMKKALSVPLIINDRVDIALAANANGVHLGQGDLPPQTARKMLGNKIIGVTAFTAQHMKEIDKDIVDYAGIGAVYPTLTKPDKKVLGCAGLKELINICPVPAIAIGGITAQNAAPTIKAGAVGVAAIRGAGSEQAARAIVKAL